MIRKFILNSYGFNKNYYKFSQKYFKIDDI